MGFSPEEIEHKQFMHAVRGFDRDEVKAFLRVLAEDWRRVTSQAQVVNGTTANGAGEDLALGIGSEVANVLRTAAGAAGSLLDRARDTAALVRREAEAQAAAIRQAAHDEANAIHTSTAAERDSAASEARMIIEEAHAHVFRLRDEAMRRLASIRDAEADLWSWLPELDPPVEANQLEAGLSSAALDDPNRY